MPPNRVISCGPRLPRRLRLTYGPVRVVPRVRHRRRSERHRLRLAVGVVAVAVRGVLEESHDVVCRQPEHGIVAAKKSIDICTVQYICCRTRTTKRVHGTSYGKFCDHDQEFPRLARKKKRGLNMQAICND